MTLRKAQFFQSILCISAILLVSACDFGRDVDPSLATVPTQTLPAKANEAVVVEETPTILPSRPTRPPTATPQATPTYDPALAAWTVMVYMDADNNLEPAGLLDINEMEAAGVSEQVNLLVQMDRAVGQTSSDGDWTEARRYLIQGDDDPTLISSELAMSLGEVNMGDPSVLADFLAWGISNFPANRYALIMWDHGSGWNGFAFDEDVGFPDQSDHITLPDLEKGLGDALAQTNVDRLDVVGFDACLMGQLEVLQALQPYADYAVGSEELTPGQGWDYTAVLRHLYEDPSLDGSDLARHMVDEFVEFYTTVEPDDFVTMAAVNLAKLPDLTYEVEQLSRLLTSDPVFMASAVGDARSGTEAFARVYADEFDHYATVDLYQFASILSQRVPDEQVILAAEKVMDSIEAAVIANEYGSGFRKLGGISIYFPRTSEFYASPYRQQTGMPHWDAFLSSYHNTGLADLPPPQIEFTNVLSQVVSLQNPAYMEFEIVGRDIENVVIVGGQHEENGRMRLLEYDNLIPEPSHLPDGSQIVEWRDGVHEDFFVWSTKVTFLYDAAGNGDYVVMWPTDYGSPLFTVQGRYYSAAGNEYVDANLVFDHGSGQLTRVWGLQGEAAAEIMPKPGDEFQLYSMYREANGNVQREPGPMLQFDETGRIYFDWRPLPDGDYSLGFVAQNVAGDKGEAFVDFVVDNSHTVQGYQAYLDPYLGFQFFYPHSWHTPTYDNALLYTSNSSGSTQLQITIYPNLERGIDANRLSNETLKQFGPVDLLYPAETMNVAGIGGLRNVYGYESAEHGQRTGIFVTFVSNGTGYIIDVDGAMADEADTIAIVDRLVTSWEFKPVNFGLQPGKWTTINLDAFSVAQPSDFTYQEVKGWQRFNSDRLTFVALRSQPETVGTGEVLNALVRDAGEGVENFVVHEPFRFPLSGAAWWRADFSYTGDNRTEIWGFIMVKVEDGKEVVAWAEAPATNYNDLESRVFLVMIADMTLVE